MKEKTLIERQILDASFVCGKDGRVTVEVKRAPTILKVGVIVRVKPGVWWEWCLRHCEEHKPFKPQPITNCPIRKPYIDYVMLAYPPRYWWRCDEVEAIDQ